MSQRAVATVIGDVVGSRHATSRVDLHDRLTRLVASVNADAAPVTPLRITVGDEYQGAFASVGAALAAVRRIQRAAGGDIDLRHGIGWGEVSVLADEPRVEDGPGWWAAREAIEAVAADQQRAGLRHLRTAYRCASGETGPAVEAVNAALMLRDQAYGALAPRSVSVLHGLMDGRSQRDIAEAEGVSPSAISQRVRHDGIAVILAADELLGRLT